VDIDDWRYRPAARRAVYPITAARTLMATATVACNVTGSTTVGFGGQLIKITAGLPVAGSTKTNNPTSTPASDASTPNVS
jgi:hypothetical protein